MQHWSCSTQRVLVVLQIPANYTFQETFALIYLHLKAFLLTPVYD